MTETSVDPQLIRDDISTIPKGIIGLLSDHASENPIKYKPSYVAQIINRSINPAFIDTDIVEKQGHYVVKDPVESHMEALSKTNLFYPPYEVQYRGITYPGLTYGQAILKSLDTHLDILSEQDVKVENILRLAALSTVVVTSTHPFSDANGRTGIGLADYFVHLSLHKTLNYDYLTSQAKKIDEVLALSTTMLLPKKYHPSNLIAEMKQRNQTTTEVKLSAKELHAKGELLPFLANFKDNIILAIEEYDPLDQKNDFFSVNTHIASLANIYASALNSAMLEGFLRKVTQTKNHLVRQLTY